MNQQIKTQKDHMDYKRLFSSMGALALASGLLQAAPMGTAFTYQGSLSISGAPATGLYDLSFTAWDAVTNGTQFGGIINLPAVPVTNGLFMATLDFGNIYGGNARWLAISVKTNLAASYTVLAPRQPLTPSPYTIFATGSGSANLALGVAAGSVTSAGLAPGAVTTPAIAANAVTTAKIAANSITHVELANDALSLPKVTAGIMTNWGNNIVVSGTGSPIATNTFTGLGFQYYGATGEGAIMSSFNDLSGFLSFYTKNGPGNAPQRHLIVRGDGEVGVVGPDRFVVKASGNVGVGTNNPQVVLDVYGTQDLGANSDGIVNIGDTAGYHVSLDNNELHGRYGTSVSDLFLNGSGGTVWVAQGSLVAQNGAVGIGNYWLPGDSALDVNGQVRLNDSNIVFRAGTDLNYGLGYYGATKTFAGLAPDGPVLFGYSGGILGTEQYGTERVAVSWDSGQNVRAPGLLRSGSETGTSQAPSPAGMVVRRINSTVSTALSIVARTDNLTLERDGSNGGFLIRYPALPGNLTIACMGINSAGTQQNFYTGLTNPAVAGTVQVYTNSQAIVHFECSFGITAASGRHVTKVTLSRWNGDLSWMGELSSTFNQ